MKPDASLLLQMQLALMGIVLVTGLFYLWRSLCRIEDKVTRLSSIVGNQDIRKSSAGTAANAEDFRSVPLNFADADSAAEELMKQVFGDTEEVVLIHSSQQQQQPTAVGQVVIEDVTQPEAEIEPQPSEADTDVSNPLSKSKLNKMSPDQLKDLAIQRGLSSDGNKKALIDRLLGLAKD